MAESVTSASSGIEGLLDPEDVTGWLVEFRLNASAPCPLGFVCEKERMANCTKIRAVSLTYGFGDVHGGGYCPEGVDALQLCPVGHYCPTADELVICPPGFYCPYKTAFPEYNCYVCEEGQETLVRDWYGYLLLFLLFALMICGILVSMVRRYRADLVARFVDLSSRSLDSAAQIYRRKKRLEQLERLKPKLFAIRQRLLQVEQGKSEASSSADSSLRLSAIAQDTAKSGTGLSVLDSGKISYESGRLFDALDADGNGTLDFDELQKVLELEPEQLQEFVQRMNELAGNPSDTGNVSRQCFTRHFLQVLEESTQFGPTTAEVEALFQELSRGEEVAAYEDFFDSRLSSFLSDPQINDLIARLRKAAAEEQETNGMRRQTGEALQDEGVDLDRDKDFSEPSATSGAGAGAGGGHRKASLGLYGAKPASLQSSFHASKFSVASLFSAPNAENLKRYIHHDTFVKHYSVLLSQATNPAGEAGNGTTEEHTASMRGVDLAFEDLSLTVSVGDKKVNVVNHVTGRLEAKTMTALMGGSGAGKTSLLNALCGRAFYGETTGTIRINGHVTTIEEHSSCSGFVPQDDIVHPELTVRENLVYSGKFSLPKGTSLEAIEELADQVLAQLGLSRVANSMVGDVNRRGVSGGEKKRVNIGLELMSRPSILFLDEPTSGLDSSSALLVMSSLKNLVQTQGMTVLSVIHQPRKAIFDSFDSLILLGVGGNMVFHGAVAEAEGYFADLSKPYLLPKGESLADWLIDVSSGGLAPNDATPTLGGKYGTDSIQARRHGKRHASADDDGYDHDGNFLRTVSTGGTSSAKFESSLQKAKERRQNLFDCWDSYYKTLSDQERGRYMPPLPYDLPVKVEKPNFWVQLRRQIHRNLLFTWRNRISKIFDTTMIVGAVVVISWLQGVTNVTLEQQPGLTFDQLVEGDPYEIPTTFPNLFKYAIDPTAILLQYALKVGVITAVLIGLTAAKGLTSKRLEFFREAGSGWDINAYFLALNITSTVEHTLQIVVAAGCAYWLRASLSAWYSYQLHFLMLMWMTVSWSLLIPLLVPANNTVVAVGFFTAFFGLLFSGAIDPVKYQDIYAEGNSGMALFAGTVSVTRYFIEGMTVQEQRCLPAQSGFTVEPTSVNFPVDSVASFHLTGLAQNDLSVVQLSCNGWYWGVYVAFMVGLSIRVLAAGVLHASDRSKQSKRSLWHDLRQRPLARNKTFRVVVVFILLVVMMFSVSGWLILNQVGETGIQEQPSTEAEAAEMADVIIANAFPGMIVGDFDTNITPGNIAVPTGTGG